MKVAAESSFNIRSTAKITIIFVGKFQFRNFPTLGFLHFLNKILSLLALYNQSTFIKE